MATPEVDYFIPYDERSFDATAPDYLTPECHEALASVGEYLQSLQRDMLAKVIILHAHYLPVTNMAEALGQQLRATVEPVALTLAPSERLAIAGQDPRSIYSLDTLLDQDAGTDRSKATTLAIAPTNLIGRLKEGPYSFLYAPDVALDEVTAYERNTWDTSLFDEQAELAASKLLEHDLLRDTHEQPVLTAIHESAQRRFVAVTDMQCRLSA